MKWVTRALVALFVLGVLIAGSGLVAFTWFDKQITRPGPVTDVSSDRTILIPTGSGRHQDWQPA